MRVRPILIASALIGLSVTGAVAQSDSNYVNNYGQLPPVVETRMVPGTATIVREGTQAPDVDGDGMVCGTNQAGEQVCRQSTFNQLFTNPRPNPGQGVYNGK